MEKVARALMILTGLLMVLLIGVQIGIYHGRSLEAEEWKVELEMRRTQIEHLRERIEELEKRLIEAKEELEIKRLVHEIVLCESSGRHEVWGKDGEFGIAQFKRETFEWLKEKFGLAGLEWKNRGDQLLLLEMALKNGYGRLWTCYREMAGGGRDG